MRRLLLALLLLSLPSCNTAKAILTSEERRAAEKAEKEAAEKAELEKGAERAAELVPQNHFPQSEPIANPTDIVESATLKKGLREALPEIYEANKEAVPDDLDKATDEMIAKMREADPKFLKVTAMAEQKFANGNFAVIDARRRMEKVTTKAQALGIALPPGPMKLAQMKDGKQPAPIRVELAAHLLEGTCRSKAKEEGKSWPEGR